MLVRLALAWTDPYGVAYGPGELVDIDAVTLAELEEQGVVKNMTDEPKDAYTGPTSPDTDGYTGPTSPDPDGYTGPTGGETDKYTGPTEGEDGYTGPTSSES